VISARVRGAHPRRALLVCLAASATVHAAVLALLPGRALDPAPPAASRLEVVVLQPTPLAQELTVPAPRSPQAAVGKTSRPAQATPDLSHPPADEPLPFPVAADHPGPQLAVPEARLQAPTLSATPPSYRAAYLSNPAPRYPDAARRSGEQGMVTLRVQVARDGAASRVAVEKSSGSPHLDAAALEAVKAWRFAPARQGGNAVESWMLVPIVFRLEGAS